MVSAARRAAPAVLTYAAIKLVGLLVLAFVASRDGKSFGRALTFRGDAGWYVRLIENGYGHIEVSTTVRDDRAFFPLYPALGRLVDLLTPFGARGAAAVVSFLAALIAAWGLFAIGDHLGGRRVGFALAVLWGVLPNAMIQTMAYTESLFTALAAWSLYAVLTKRWIWAGSITLLAGLSRPTAFVLIATVWLAALLEAIRERRIGWRLALGAGLAPLGWLSYVLWVGSQFGSIRGYFTLQAGWGNEIDFGRSTAWFLVHLLQRGTNQSSMFVASLSLVIAILLFVISLVDRVPVPLLAYAGLMLSLALLSDCTIHPKMRFVMTAFPLLLPIATRLAKARTAIALPVLGWLTAFSAFAGSSLVIYHHWAP